MIYEIKPIAEEHISGFRATLDAVARERRFLSFMEAPPFEQLRSFVLNNIKERRPQFVVIVDDQVVGWCDVLPNLRRTVSAHCATLGMGLLPEYRGHGIGRKLIERALHAAFVFGFKRIELTVREANFNAIALYKRVGFETEGLHRKAVLIEGDYENTLSMALIAEQ
ncbi:GNAT family N-acetyltransferase [Bradyrhizobium sp. 179]|uniref:GNAT family N-acetyltransferase n=1 Tax=Bradyrhizobium sp. 179 TaxID=2782648 RepID=UPI001FFB0094|nr:GNAT family N-acetyltransferase [Bradyrhizobium sp. 179]MCK1542518.1 GNAT family N-acetyltransferase [Bradyrhizobium sp. 179]